MQPRVHGARTVSIPGLWCWLGLMWKWCPFFGPPLGRPCGACHREGRPRAGPLLFDLGTSSSALPEPLFKLVSDNRIQRPVFDGPLAVAADWLIACGLPRRPSRASGIITDLRTGFDLFDLPQRQSRRPCTTAIKARHERSPTIPQRRKPPVLRVEGVRLPASAHRQ